MGAETMRHKARRLLIDLNRLIEEEDARYNRKELKLSVSPSPFWKGEQRARPPGGSSPPKLPVTSRTPPPGNRSIPPRPGCQPPAERLPETYLPERLEQFAQRLRERALISDELVRKAAASEDWLRERLEREFMKDSLARRQAAFLQRTHDRTVHPTQAYPFRPN